MTRTRWIRDGKVNAHSSNDLNRSVSVTRQSATREKLLNFLFVYRQNKRIQKSLRSLVSGVSLIVNCLLLLLLLVSPLFVLLRDHNAESVSRNPWQNRWIKYLSPFVDVASKKSKHRVYI